MATIPKLETKTQNIIQKKKVNQRNIKVEHQSKTEIKKEGNMENKHQLTKKIIKWHII